MSNRKEDIDNEGEKVLLFSFVAALLSVLGLLMYLG